MVETSEAGSVEKQRRGFHDRFLQGVERAGDIGEGGVSLLGEVLTQGVRVTRAAFLKLFRAGKTLIMGYEKKDAT